jgi:hypothetical protein
MSATAVRFAREATTTQTNSSCRFSLSLNLPSTTLICVFQHNESPFRPGTHVNKGGILSGRHDQATLSTDPLRDGLPRQVEHQRQASIEIGNAAMVHI